MNKTLGIFGFGYTAKAVAKRMEANGYTIYATSRSKQTREHFSTPAITLLDFDLSGAEKILSTCRYILICVPPDKTACDPVLSQFKQSFINHKDHLEWIGYLSSTGVYGDHQGQWVTETSKSIDPGRAGLARLKAEAAWLDLFRQYDLPVQCFRLAGIYGPKKSSISRILAGKTQAIYKPGQVFSRIHVDDIAKALHLSLLNPMPGEVFNVCDNLPAPSHEVDQFAAKIMQRPPLELIDYEQADLSPMAFDFYRCNKRVSNEKIKKNLNFEPQYPTYKEGLKALMKRSKSST